MKKLMIALLLVISALGFSATELETKDIELRKGISYYNGEIMEGEYLLKVESMKPIEKELTISKRKITGTQVYFLVDYSKGKTDFTIKEAYNLNKVLEFKKYVKEGYTYSEYYKNGKLYEKNSIKLGSSILNGPYEIYNEEGILIEKGQVEVKKSRFYRGVMYRSKKDGIITKYYNNGKIKEEVPFESGAKNGIAKNYDEKGNITQIVYKFGKIVK